MNKRKLSNIGWALMHQKQLEQIEMNKITDKIVESAIGIYTVERIMKDRSK